MIEATADARKMRAAAFREAAQAVASAIETGRSAKLVDYDRLLSELAKVGPTDPKSRRRLILQQYRWRFYPGVSVSAAARIISSEWKTVARGGFVEPGSRFEFFRRLEDLGFRPLSWRTIVDELDPTLG